MPEDVTARQARQAEYYQQKKAAGLKPLRNFVYTDEDRAMVHEACRKLREAYETGQRVRLALLVDRGPGQPLPFTEEDL